MWHFCVGSPGPFAAIAPVLATMVPEKIDDICHEFVPEYLSRYVKMYYMCMS